MNQANISLVVLDKHEIGPKCHGSIEASNKLWSLHYTIYIQLNIRFLTWVSPHILSFILNNVRRHYVFWFVTLICIASFREVDSTLIRYALWDSFFFFCFFFFLKKSFLTMNSPPPLTKPKHINLTLWWPIRTWPVCSHHCCNTLQIGHFGLWSNFVLSFLSMYNVEHLCF